MKRVISDNMTVSTIVLFITSTALFVSSGKIAGSDSWVSILISMFIAMIIIVIYARIMILHPDKNFFEIIEFLFGKILGKIICIIYTFYVVYLGAMQLYFSGEYMITASFPETPQFVPKIFFAILITWAVKEGIEIIGRFSLLFIFVFGLILLILIIFLIPEMEISNIQPFLLNNPKLISKGIIDVLTSPFLQIIIFTMIFTSSSFKQSYYKILLKGHLLSGVILLCISISAILLLGEDIFRASNYPINIMASKIAVTDLLQRSEAFTLLGTLLSQFTKLSICLLAGTMGITKIFEINDYKIIVIPTSLLMFSLSFLAYENIFDRIAFKNEIYPYYQILIQIIIPLIIFIVAEIKNRNVKHEEYR